MGEVQVIDYDPGAGDPEFAESAKGPATGTATGSATATDPGAKDPEFGEGPNRNELGLPGSVGEGAGERAAGPIRLDRLRGVPLAQPPDGRLGFLHHGAERGQARRQAPGQGPAKNATTFYDIFQIKYLFKKKCSDCCTFYHFYNYTFTIFTNLATSEGDGERSSCSSVGVVWVTRHSGDGGQRGRSSPNAHRFREQNDDAKQTNEVIDQQELGTGYQALGAFRRREGVGDAAGQGH